MRARSSAVFDSVVIYGIKVEEIQSRVSFWCGALNFRIFFDLLMFACQVTQRPYPQLQQLQQSLNMCWNHSEATIAKPAGLWDSQIRTEHNKLWQNTPMSLDVLVSCTIITEDLPNKTFICGQEAVQCLICGYCGIWHQNTENPCIVW